MKVEIRTVAVSKNSLVAKNKICARVPMFPSSLRSNSMYLSVKQENVIIKPLLEHSFEALILKKKKKKSTHF